MSLLKSADFERDPDAVADWRQTIFGDAPQFTFGFAVEDAAHDRDAPNDE